MGEKRSRNSITAFFFLLIDFLDLIANLYIPPLIAKKTPNADVIEFFNLHYKRSISLVYLDNKRCFFEYLRALRKLNKYDLSKIKNGVGIWLSTSGLFSWSGASFKISKKILEHTKSSIARDDSRNILYYELFKLLYCFFSGDWDGITDYSETQMDYYEKTGEIWHLSTLLVFHGFVKIETGKFMEAQKIVIKMNEIWVNYGIEDAGEYVYSLKTGLLIKSRKLNEALNEVNVGIALQSERGRELAVLYYYGLKGTIEVLLRDIEAATDSFSRAEEFVSKMSFIPPLYFGSYLVGQFLLSLYMLENAIVHKEYGNIRKYRKMADIFGKRALRNSLKHCKDLPEVRKLLGRFQWLIGNHRRANEEWRRSIDEGERLGTHVELSRVYFEVGKRLSENGRGDRAFNGIRAEDYIEKAKAKFREMDLKWDMAELDRVACENLP